MTYSVRVEGMAVYRGDRQSTDGYDGLTVGKTYKYTSEGDDSTEVYFEGMIDTENDLGEQVHANGLDFDCTPCDNPLRQAIRDARLKPIRDKITANQKRQLPERFKQCPQ